MNRHLNLGDAPMLAKLLHDNENVAFNYSSETVNPYFISIVPDCDEKPGNIPCGAYLVGIYSFGIYRLDLTGNSCELSPDYLAGKLGMKAHDAENIAELFNAIRVEFIKLSP